MQVRPECVCMDVADSMCMDAADSRRPKKGAMHLGDNKQGAGGKFRQCVRQATIGGGSNTCSSLCKLGAVSVRSACGCFALPWLLDHRNGRQRWRRF